MTYIVIVAALAMAFPILVLLLGYALAACAWLAVALCHAIAWSLEALARVAALLEHRSQRR